MTWRFWKTDLSGIAVMLALAGGAYAAGFRPLLESWSNKSGLESRLRTERSTLQAATSDLARFEDQFGNLTRQIDQLEITLLPRARVNQRLDALTDLAVQHDIAVESAIKAGENEAPLFGVVQIRIQARGDYRELAEFLRSLHLRYRDISVRSFEITSEAVESRQARIVVELDWYVIPGNRQKR